MNYRWGATLLLVLASWAQWAGAAERAERPLGKQSLSAVEWASRIDQRIDAHLKTAGLPKSPPATDEEFVRRVYLDLHGVVPTVAQATSFLSDKSSAKRAQLIDRLLAEPQFAAHLADLWDDYLMPTADDPRLQRPAFKGWLQNAFQTKNWDQLTRDLLTATGQRDADPVVLYLLKGRETRSPAELTDLVSQYFMGVRFNCAQCHDHPFTTWKRTDYWGMAAFFTQIQYTDRRQLKSGVIRDNPAVALDKLEESARLGRLKFPAGDECRPGEVPHREAFARWLTAQDNPFFARAAVNRAWAQLFGKGLVEPVDDMHDGNPATHPELLDQLSAGLVAADFDLRALYRTLGNTAAYQRTSRPVSGNEGDGVWLSRMRLKLLSPEQLYESLKVVLPPTAESKRFQRGDDPREEFVQFFRGEGESDATAYSRGIPQTLRLMNSEQFWTPLREAEAVRHIIGDNPTDDQAVDRLYLRVLTRQPTEDERQTLSQFLSGYAGNRWQAQAEILWALVNSSEFSLNH